MTKSTWRKVDESVVYMNGILGECPPRGETHLSPIDLHPLPRRTTIAWAFVYGERIDEKKFTRVLSQEVLSQQRPGVKAQVLAPRENTFLQKV